MKKKGFKKIKDAKLLAMVKQHKREGMEKDFLELLKRAVKFSKK